MNAIKNILIIKPSSLGDIVQGLPVARALRGKFPSAGITWIANREYTEFLQLCPYIDNIIPFERKQWGKIFRIGKTVCEFKKFIDCVRNYNCDIALDPQGLFRSGLVAYLSNVPQRAGFDNARDFAHIFYTSKVNMPEERKHAIERYLTLAEYLGCDYNESISNPYSGVINVVDSSHIAGDEYDIIVNPGGRWQTKRWPPAYYIALINKLYDRQKLKMALIGGNNDRDICSQIAGSAKNAVINLAGKTGLKELVSIINKCTVFITNDSGPMHIANALSKNIVALFGPTDPGLTGPWGDHNTVIKSRISCSPCFKRTCRHITCMDNIKVDDVLKAVEEFL